MHSHFLGSTLRISHRDPPKKGGLFQPVFPRRFFFLGPQNEIPHRFLHDGRIFGRAPPSSAIATPFRAWPILPPKVGGVSAIFLGGSGIVNGCPFTPHISRLWKRPVKRWNKPNLLTTIVRITWLAGHLIVYHCKNQAMGPSEKRGGLESVFSQGWTPLFHGGNQILEVGFFS